MILGAWHTAAATLPVHANNKSMLTLAHTIVRNSASNCMVAASSMRCGLYLEMFTNYVVQTLDYLNPRLSEPWIIQTLNYPNPGLSEPSII